MRRRVPVEWFAVAGGLLALAGALIATAVPQRLDLTLYDAAQRLALRAPHKDIVIIAIDERSLTALGRWPWPRETHARLIDRLTEAGARAVALDLLLSEPDALDPRGDAQLAASLAHNARTVLPLHMDAVDRRVRAIPPAPLFAAATRMTGHVNTELDTRGFARANERSGIPLTRNRGHSLMSRFGAAQEMALSCHRTARGEKPRMSNCWSHWLGVFTTLKASTN